MARGVSEKTKRLTLGAVLAAMGVVLLTVGAFIEVLDLSMAALASFLCIFAVIEMGKGYSVMIYVVTGLLSVILMPQSLCAWFYLLFFGFYPIVKERFEGLSRPLAWILKLIVFNVSLTTYALISYFLFFADIEALLIEFSSLLGGIETGTILIAIIYVILNAVFIIYDFALTKLITLYLVKLRKKFRFLK